MNPLLSLLAAIMIRGRLCKVHLPEDYSKHQFPPPAEEDRIFNLTLSFNLIQGIVGQDILLRISLSVREINEVEGTARIKISTRRVWQDRRLTFSSFGEGQTSAKISPDEWEDLWVPWTVYANMKDGSSWIKSDKPDGYSAKFVEGYNSSADVHLGSDIVIEYEKEMIVELMCNYDMFWYPFDSQTCRVELYQREEGISLISKAAVYSGPRQLIQYTVIGIEMCPTVFQVE